MSATVTALPSGRRHELLAALAASPAPEPFLEALQIFAEENWGLSELDSLVEAIDWQSDCRSLDRFARLLSNYCIDFDEPLDEGTGSDKASAEEQEAAASLAKIVNEVKATSRMLAFRRALPIAAVLNDVLQDKSPVRVIETHMREVFRSESPVELEQPAYLNESAPLVTLFRWVAKALAQAFPRDARAEAITYFLASPYREAGKVTIERLRELRKLSFPCRRLLFIRSTVPLYERLDPTPEKWSDLKWVFEFASADWELTRVINACFELMDQAADLFDDDGDSVEATVNAFFANVRREQEEFGGRSFWDEDTATHKVYGYFRYHAYLENVRTDFHSHLCWIAQGDHERGEPGFDEWHTIVTEALNEGYVALAQALTAYKLYEDVLLLDRITDWPAFTALNRLLRQESHYDMLALAMRTCAQVWEQRGHDLLPARLLAQAPAAREPPQKNENRILHVIEGASRAGSKEVEARLIEHVGPANWNKLAPESQKWLIEADMNWSDFNFRPPKEYERTDWSYPATLFFKAIEHELVRRYGSVCREAGDVTQARDKEVTFGLVVRFLREANKAGSERALILKKASIRPVSPQVVRQLQYLRDKYRNPGAHSAPFDQALLSALRWDLFGNDTLRAVLDSLA